VYPIAVESRTDVPKEILLHTFDTKNTVVRSVEEMQSAYKKMESVVRGHRRSLIKKTSTFAAHAWAPGENSNFNPVLAGGAGKVNKFGFNAVSFEDFLHAEARFRELDVDMSNVVAVLTSMHMADLMAEDMKLYKEVLSSGKLFSFKLFSFSQLPYYDLTTGKRKPIAAALSANHSQGSLLYVQSEVARAQGDMDMFAKYKDPEHRGDIIGFQQRFTAAPITGKYTGAIYSSKL
ncbi:MAG: hypothetical protein RSC76_04260, partial [Oscillospiraceae bacterium]